MSPSYQRHFNDSHTTSFATFCFSCSNKKISFNHSNMPVALEDDYSVRASLSGMMGSISYVFLFVPDFFL